MTVLTGVSGHFSAAHRSTDGDLHGHTWQVMAWFKTPTRADAVCYKASLDSLLRSWDHSELPDQLSWAEDIAAAVGRLVNCVEVVVSRPLEGFHARWIAPPQGIEAGTAETQSGSVHESPVGHQADAPETVAAPIPVEGEILQADIRHLAAILEEWDMKEPPNAWTGHSYEAIAADALTRIAAHRRAFSGGVDEVREALETAIGRLAWTACANPGVRHRDGRKLVEGWVAEGRAVLDALSTIKEPRA